jgi:hypothetical protein
MSPEEIMKRDFGVEVGTRVVSISSIDRFDAFLIDEIGLTGTVELMNDLGDLMVRLDKHFDELNDDDNCLTYPNDGDEDGFLGAFSQEFKPIKSLPFTLTKSLTIELLGYNHFFVFEKYDEGFHFQARQDTMKFYANGVYYSEINSWNYCGVEIGEIENSYLYKWLTAYKDISHADTIETCIKIEKQIMDVVLSMFKDE